MCFALCDPEPWDIIKSAIPTQTTQDLCSGTKSPFVERLQEKYNDKDRMDSNYKGKVKSGSKRRSNRHFETESKT